MRGAPLLSSGWTLSPRPALFYIGKSALHTLALLAPRANSSTRRWGLVAGSEWKMTPIRGPMESTRFPTKTGQSANNEQVWVSTLSGRADTDGLESSASDSFIAAYIFHLGRPQCKQGFGCLKRTVPYLAEVAFFSVKIWLNWFGGKQWESISCCLSELEKRNIEDFCSIYTGSPGSCWEWVDKVAVGRVRESCQCHCSHYSVLSS